jgi:hypothetical protein
MVLVRMLMTAFPPEYFAAIPQIEGADQLQ